jgi:hypothetical protein
MSRDPERRRRSNQAYRDRNRDAIRVRARAAGWYSDPARRRHGLAIPDTWAAMWDAQNGQCYLCGDPLDDRSTHVDHDHSCCPPGRSCQVCRRGLACGNCNVAIGLAADDPDRLEQIAGSLRAAKAAVALRLAGRPEQSAFDLDGLDEPA